MTEIIKEVEKSKEGKLSAQEYYNALNEYSKDELIIDYMYGLVGESEMKEWEEKRKREAEEQKARSEKSVLHPVFEDIVRGYQEINEVLYGGKGDIFYRKGQR